MRTYRADKLARTARIQQASASRQLAADIFRQRFLDSTLKRLLKRHEQKTQATALSAHGNHRLQKGGAELQQQETT